MKNIKLVSLKYCDLPPGVVQKQKDWFTWGIWLKLSDCLDDFGCQTDKILGQYLHNNQ